MTVKKSKKFTGFVIFFLACFKGSAFTAVERVQRYKLFKFVKGVPFINRRYQIRNGYLFLLKMVYKSARGWTSESEPPSIRLC